MTTVQQTVPPRHVMDREHEVQIGLIQALKDALEAGKEKDAVGAILRQLRDYSDIHFMSEQLLMRNYAYPDFEGHELAHERMMDILDDMRDRFAQGDLEAMKAACDTVRTTLIQHINSMDRAFGDFLVEQREGQAPPKI